MKIMPLRESSDGKSFKSELSSYSNEDNADLNNFPTGAAEATGISASQHEASLGLWSNTLKLDFRRLLKYSVKRNKSSLASSRAFSPDFIHYP